MLRTLIASALIAGCALPAAADPPFCPPGHAKKGQCGPDRRDDRRAEDRAYEQGYRDGHKDGRWEVGGRLSRDTQYEVIRDYGRYGYREPPSGYYYARVDGQTLLIQATTLLIAEALTR